MHKNKIYFYILAINIWTLKLKIASNLQLFKQKQILRYTDLTYTCIGLIY